MAGAPRASAGVALAIVLLGGCSVGGAPGSSPPGGHARGTQGPARRLPASTSAPTRSVRCGTGEAHGRAAPRPTSDEGDVVVGPLRWPGLKRWQDARRTDFGGRTEGGWYYKIGAEVEQGSAVTVSVAPEARRRAGLRYGQEEDYAPAQEVVFSGCPDADTVYFGGFFVSGHGRLCLPLDIRAGGSPPRRIVISLFSGACRA